MTLKLYGNTEPTSATMLQGFYWDAAVNGTTGPVTRKWYEFVKTKIASMKQAGVEAVWLPPPGKERHQDNMGYTCLDYYDVGEHRQWVQLEDPNDSTQLNWQQHDGIETRFGSRTALQALIASLKAEGIAAVADIVINHRKAQQVNGQGEFLRWGSAAHIIASNKMVWGTDTDDPPEVVVASGGGGYHDDGEGGFAPNLAHANPDVRRQVKEWLLWLKQQVGFEGWRYDYVKGFAANHLGEYNYHSRPCVSVGECWAGTQEIYDWIDGTDAYHVGQRSMAFDFPLKFHLSDVFRGDKPFHQLGLWRGALASVAGGWRAKAVTFLDNHDTCRNEYHQFPLDSKRLAQGYAFVLTHPGLPCIFWKHLFQSGASVYHGICRLAQTRRQLGITNESDAEVIRWQNDCYAARLDSRVVVKIGDEWWSPGSGWKLRVWGRGWAVWSL